MNYYIDVIPSDPRNDVRPVWTEDMLQSAISEAKSILTLINNYRDANSTAERIEAMRMLKGSDTICFGMIMEEISEQLSYLKDNKT